jgi:hypothetical protein
MHACIHTKMYKPIPSKERDFDKVHASSTIKVRVGIGLLIVLGVIGVIGLTAYLTWLFIPRAHATAAFYNNETLVIVDAQASKPHRGYNGLNSMMMMGNISEPDFYVDADVFDMKLVAIYLAEDVDPVSQDNRGLTSMFYLNPQCLNDDISNCGTGVDLKYQVTDFFHYAQNSSLVNAEINAQQRSIQWFDPSGFKTSITYRFVRIENCKFGAGPPNLRFKGGNMTTSHSFAVDACGITFPIDPPLVVKSGDNLRVELSYSLKNLIWGYNNNNAGINSTWCASDNTTSYCVQMPNFVPSVYRI